MSAHLDPRVPDPPPVRRVRAAPDEAGPGRLALTASAFCLGIAFAAGALAVVYNREAGFAGLALLGGLVIVGFGVLAAYAMRRPQKRAQDRRGKLLSRAFDLFPDPLALTRDDGGVVFANIAYRRMAGGLESRRPLPPELAARADADMAGRLYRLARAASGEIAATADIRSTIGGVAHWRRVSVEPVTLANDGRTLAFWRFKPLADVTSGEVSERGEVVAFRPEAAKPAEAAAPAAAFEALFASAPMAIALIEPDGRIETANAAFAAFVEAESAAALKGRAVADFVAPDDRAEALAVIARAAKGDDPGAPADLRFGSSKTGQLHAMSVRRGEGSDSAVALHVSDTTSLKSLERQFAQSQKMQAIGKLAGGVAHDFNNILTAISGFTEMLLVKHKPGDASFADLMQIKNGAMRAARLVGQLLAFSRQQTLQPKVHAPNDLLSEVNDLLRRLMTEKIALRQELGRDVWPVRVDGTQFDTMIVNLAVNARDAMPNGGALTIRTSNVTEAQSRAEGHDVLAPGDYVLVEVSDTGTGIAPENLAKIFEPFFTTKAVGAGTGLGLSMVYGFVKQSGGYVFPVSELGQGTTFKIYLPRYVEGESHAEASQEPEKPQARDLTGMGTILLVEDDDSVRNFATRALTLRGYTVLEANGGEAALEIVRAYEKPIHILISDVVMPNMDGPELVKAAKKIRPEMRVVFISGYAEDSFRRQAETDEDVQFLPKPFSLKQLAAKVKDVMAGAA